MSGNSVIDQRTGPDYAFAQTLRELGVGEMAIVRTAEGGTPIHTEATRVDWNPDSRGELFDLLLDTVSKAVLDLQSKGYEVEIKGIFWMQGEADTLSVEQADAYEGLLEDFLAQLRSRLGMADLPVYLGEILKNDALAGNARVREIQSTVADNDPTITLVHTDGFEQRDAPHFSETGYFRLGEEFAREYLGLESLNYINGTDASETLTLPTSTSRIYGGGGHDVIDGNDADNAMFGELGMDTLRGLGGNDLLFGGNGNDQVYGGNGNDYLNGGGDDDILYGDAGNDSLFGAAGDDILYGGAGNDILNGANGNDQLYGGTGNDVYVVEFPYTTVVELAGEGTDSVHTTLTLYTLEDQVENLVYTGHAVFKGYGNELANVIVGGVRNDRLYGGGGSDTLSGGAGADVLDGGAGNDTLRGGVGNDIYIVDAVGDTVVELSGEGIDSVRASTQRYTLGSNVEELVFTGTSAFTGTGNELANRIFGGANADTLYGMAGDDTLYGGAGKNLLNGGDGNDILNGGSGAETLLGGRGLDILNGGAGNDTLDGGHDGDVLDGGAGNDVMIGGRGNDTFIVSEAGDVVTELANEGVDTVKTTLQAYSLGANVENLTFTGSGPFTGIGNNAANLLTGGVGSDSLAGGGGNDTLYGGRGIDVLAGGDGSDVLNGGRDRDTLTGGLGADTLTGGHGVDTFVYRTYGDSHRNASDTITDFSTAQGDRIDLSAIDANVIGGTSNDAFTYIGDRAFSGQAGELRFRNGLLLGDLNGDQRIDLQIRLTDVSNLSASSIIL